MKTRRSARWVVLLLCTAALVGLFPARVAAEDAPQAVRDARDGVVRIVQETVHGEVYVGSGFIIGTDSGYYVATNHHVVEDAAVILVFYDTEKFVEASVYLDYPALDLCVLTVHEAIPNVRILPLQTGEIDIGLAVYALGFPYAADTVSMSSEEFMTGSAVLQSNKQSMTLTDGLVSSVRMSRSIGDESREVQAIHTNANISGGNSGGPLIDSNGNVVGINTQTSTMDPNIAVSVHVQELVNVLRDMGIPFKEPRETKAPLAVADGAAQNTAIYIYAGIALGVALVCVLLVVVLLRRGRRVGGEQAASVNLDEFERGNRRLETMAAYEMTRDFVHMLLPYAGRGSLHELLTPENVIIGEDGITLENPAQTSQALRQALYPGYSAPENYAGQMTAASDVYFIGGMLYTLLTGMRPPDALGRLENRRPLFAYGDVMTNIVNKATEPLEQDRISDIALLLEVMSRMSERVFAENSHRYDESYSQQLSPQ